MSTEAGADNRFAQKEQYSISFQSHTPNDSVPPIPPQRIQSLLPSDRGPSTCATSNKPVPRSAFDTTSVVLVHYDQHETSSFNPVYHHSLYQQTARTFELAGCPMPSLTIMTSVSSYLPTAPLPNVPRTPIGEWIDQLNAKHQRAMAFKAATSPTQPQPAPCRHYVKPPTGSALHSKYAISYDSTSASFSSHASGAPALAFDAFDPRDHSRSLEHASYA